jgi:hypothetical protein
MGMKNPARRPAPILPTREEGMQDAQTVGGTNAATNPETTALTKRKGVASSTMERKERQAS